MQADIANMICSADRHCKHGLQCRQHWPWCGSDCYISRFSGPGGRKQPQATGAGVAGMSGWCSRGWPASKEFGSSLIGSSLSVLSYGSLRPGWHHNSVRTAPCLGPAFVTCTVWL